MKKVIAFAAVAMVALASCKKDYTCTCTYDLMGESMSVDAPLNDMKKKDAEEACDAADATYSMYGGAACELK